MTLQQFNAARLIIALIVAAVVGQAVVQNKYMLAMAALFIAIILMRLFKRRVTEVIEDERDHEIAGRAALIAMKTFAICGSIVTLVLLSLRQNYPAYEAAGSVLAYATCAILLLYSFVYNYLVKRPDEKI